MLYDDNDVNTGYEIELIVSESQLEYTQEEYFMLIENCYKILRFKTYLIYESQKFWVKCCLLITYSTYFLNWCYFLYIINN